MKPSDKLIEEIAAYKTQPVENLTIQDALILIPVVTAEIDRKDIPHMLQLAHAHSLFPEDKKDTEKRINRFANLITAVERSKAIDLGAKSLTPELRETAFAWTAELILQGRRFSEEKKNKVLENLRIALSIDNEAAGRILRGVEIESNAED